VGATGEPAEDLLARRIRERYRQSHRSLATASTSSALP